MIIIACGACTQAAEGPSGQVLPEIENKRPSTRSLLEQVMPVAIDDGIVKIAIIVNLEQGDESRQFIDGAVSEGRAMGFTVDSFITGADEARCAKIAAGITRAGYDGLVFAFDCTREAHTRFSHDILKPIAETGIPVVTFEVFLNSTGRSSINGITTTFQNDELLVHQSLALLVSHERGGPGRPVRVLRIDAEPEAPFLARRSRVFFEYVRGGGIEEAALVRLSNPENPYGAAWEGLARVLPRIPLRSVDALWAPYDAFAGGCVEALAEAGREDIKLISIGISNNVLRLMRRHPEIWFASAAVDPKLAGMVNMRILAARLAGETLPDTFDFTPQLVKAADVTPAINIANIHLMIPNWGDGRGLLDHFQWMRDLKAAEGKYLR